MYSIGDGIRMLGHLLEHHSTDTFYARTKEGGGIMWDNPLASDFCYVGGYNVISEKMGIHSGKFFDRLVKVSGVRNGPQWDKLSTKDRTKVAKKLQAYKG